MKSKYIKIYMFILFLILVFVMVSYIELPTGVNEPNKVTMVIRSKYGSQWELISAGAKAAANEYGAEVSILAPDYDKDFQSQKNLVLSAQRNHTEAIIVAPINSDEIVEVVDTVSNNGTPIMNIVSGTMKTHFDSSLFTNYYEVGRMLAEAIEDEIGSDGRLLIVSSDSDETIVGDKMKGFSTYINENTTYKINEVLQTQGDVFSSERMVTDYLEIYNVDGIVALDSIATIGTARVIERNDLTIGVVGVNLFEENLSLIDNEYVDRVVNENFFAIGYLSVENMVNLLNDDGYVVHQLITPHIVTRENMYDETIQQIIYPIK